jgi:hypothetical protein
LKQITPCKSFIKKPLEWIGYPHRKTFEEKHSPLKWLCIITTTNVATTFGELTNQRLPFFFMEFSQEHGDKIL